MMGWNWDQMGNWGWGSHMLWSWPMMMLGGLLLVGLIVWAVQAAGRNQRVSYPPATSPATDGQPTDRAASTLVEARRTPLEIAKERYARGEISRDEYEAIRQDLQLM